MIDTHYIISDEKSFVRTIALPTLIGRVIPQVILKFDMVFM